MSVIYMVHPQHGAKVAISEEEANYDEMFGWERYDPATPEPAADDDEGEEDFAPVNEMAAPKRRGRPRSKQED